MRRSQTSTVETEKNEEALVESELAVRLSRELLGESDYRHALTLRKYGNVLMSADRLSQATEVLLQADQIVVDVLGSDSPLRVDVMKTLATAFLLSGDLQSAASLVEEANQISRVTIDNVFGVSSMEAMYHQIKRVDNTGLLVDLALTDHQYANQAFSWVLRNKGLVTRTIANYRYAQREAENDPTVQILLGNLQDARQSLVGLQLAARQSGSSSNREIILRQRKLHFRVGDGAEVSGHAKRRVTGKPLMRCGDMIGSDEVLIELVQTSLYREEQDEKGRHQTSPHYVGFHCQRS